jgi:ribosome recycling factor
MGAFRPVTFTKKELQGLTPAQRKRLKKHIVSHLETHKGIRKIVRGKAMPMLKKMKKA